MHKLSVLIIAVSLAAQAPPGAHALPPGYDADLWRRALALHEAAVVVDTHSDTTSRILDEGFDIGPRSATGHADLERIAAGGLDVQFYSIYVAAKYFGAEDFSSPEAQRTSLADGSARRALDMMDGFWLTVDAHRDRMAPCFTVADIRAAVAAGKHAALMGIEGGHAIEDDLRLLRMFYRAGVRYMTLTHGNHNHFADSSGPATPKWNGLNRLGEKVVKEMNRLGMMVDLSHVSDATFAHALRVARAPVILSHSSCRALCGHRRNVTDDMLRALRKNGGVIMINFNCGFLDDEFGKRRSAYDAQVALRERAIEARHGKGTEAQAQALAALRAELQPPPPPDIGVLIDHIVHAIEVAGPDHVGLGSDFDGVPCVPKGIDDVEHLPHVTYHLMRRGVDDATVEKVLGANLLRVFAAVEAVARDLRAEPPHMNDPATDRETEPSAAAGRR
jgi:membrane dipeptidase